MFKKKCKRCEGKVSNKYRYCPTCGLNTEKGSEENWGILGKSDFIPSTEEVRFPAGFNMIFNSLIKNLDKQFRQLDGDLGKEMMDLNKGPKIRRGGLSISISTSGNKPPEIKVNSFGNNPKFKQKERETKRELKNAKDLPQKSLKKISKLPKEEPQTNIRRLADKVIYEIEMPGVKSIKDVSIIKLENSIEIKAVAKDKAYIKLIPINMPIIDYQLEKGKLVLELEAKN